MKFKGNASSFWEWAVAQIRKSLFDHMFRAHVVGRVLGPCCGTCSGPMLWDVFGAHVVGCVRGTCCGTCLGPMLWKILDFSCDWDILWLGPHFGGVSQSHEKSHIFHVIGNYYDWGRTSVEFPIHMKNPIFFMWLGHIMWYPFRESPGCPIHKNPSVFYILM